MNRYLQIIGLLVIGTLLIQFVLFHWVGKRTIHIACMKNLKTLAYDVDSVGIYSPYVKLTGTEEAEIKIDLGFKSVEFTADPNVFSDRFRHNQKAYGMGYEIKKLNWITADITEYNGTLEYGEMWKSKYVWILFSWIQLKQENIGQS